MFKIMLKGNEFFPKLNTNRDLLIFSTQNPSLGYKLNVEEKCLEQLLDNGKKIVVKLSDEDINNLKKCRSEIIKKIKESLELMESKKDKIIVLYSQAGFVVMPESVYNHFPYSEKFIEGFLYIINKQTNLNYDYDSLQKKLNESRISEKFIDGKTEGSMIIYTIPYQVMLDYLIKED